VRYRVRNAEGQELEVGSIHELAELHRHGLVEDDDLVRQATGARWTRAGDMAALASRREQRRERRWLWSALGLAALLTATLAAAMAMMNAGR
jgi:hypothetical protein